MASLWGLLKTPPRRAGWLAFSGWLGIDAPSLQSKKMAPLSRGGTNGTGAIQTRSGTSLQEAVLQVAGSARAFAAVTQDGSVVTWGCSGSGGCSKKRSCRAGKRRSSGGGGPRRLRSSERRRLRRHVGQCSIRRGFLLCEHAACSSLSSEPARSDVPSGCPESSGLKPVLIVRCLPSFLFLAETSPKRLLVAVGSNLRPCLHVVSFVGAACVGKTHGDSSSVRASTTRTGARVRAISTHLSLGLPSTTETSRATPHY